MNKTLVVLVALLTMTAFASGAMAQGQTKPVVPAATEKPAAPAMEKQKAVEPKSEKKEAVPQAMKTSGTVAAYEVGKVIKVKDKDKETAFELTADSKVTGDVKSGAKVTVMYKKDGDKMVATDITVAAEKKVEEKKPAPAEKKS
jgi:hypothetical protein